MKESPVSVLTGCCSDPTLTARSVCHQYTNRCLLKWLKLWDTVVFGREKPVKKAKPSAEAHPPFRQSKEQQNKWKTKAQLTEEILEAELDQHKRPKYKVSRTGRGCGEPPFLTPPPW